MRKIIIIILALIIINCGIAGVTALGESLDFYRNLVDDLGIIEVFDTSEFDVETLRNRNGKIMIEECISIVEGAESDGSLYGSILNCKNPEFDYIGFRGIDVEIGDVVLTYFIYNPDTEFEDDIMCRFDYVIDHIN